MLIFLHSLLRYGLLLFLVGSLFFAWRGYLLQRPILVGERMATIIAVVLAAFIGALGYDPLTSFTASLTALGNVGPGLGEVGPYDNFAHFPASAKLVLAGAMVLGRLEIFTVLVFLSPEFWRR